MPETDPASPAEIQQRIRAYRDRVLTGRGPGASPAETAPFMRDRQWLGGIPAAAARQQEADQAALAGDDASAVEHVVIRQQTQLSATLNLLTGRLHTIGSRTVIGLRAALIAASVGATAALATQAALRRPVRNPPHSPDPSARHSDRRLVFRDHTRQQRPVNRYRDRHIRTVRRRRPRLYPETGRPTHRGPAWVRR
jgi:hypothetical protein